MIPQSVVLNDLFLMVLRNPSRLLRLSCQEWDWILRVARREGLLARLYHGLDQLGGLKKVPPKAADHLESAKVLADDHRRMIVWELDRIRHSLSHLNTTVVLLKGAAYVVLDLQAGKGRLVSDVDILVSTDDLRAVEAALIEGGWSPIKLHPYDQRYYREWMHELPPLRHETRNTDVDVHHGILPLTSRLKPNPVLLFEAAIAVDISQFKVLAPVDMVLHCATHLFYDGDLDHGLRDLVDLHELLEDFGRSEEFWMNLVPRAKSLQLQRPLFYGLRYCSRLLATRIPEHVVRLAVIGAPSRPVLKLMDALVSNVLVPDQPDVLPIKTLVSRKLLYIRSHYLRMPLYLLLPHLIRKAFRPKDEQVTQ